MSNSSDQSSGYLGGLIAGFISLSVFGLATMVFLIPAGLKKPTDRIFEGDFSARRVLQRSGVLESVKAEQAASYDEAKVAAAMEGIKAAPEAATAIAFPGSATALEALKPKPPKAPAPPKPKKPAPPKAEAPAGEVVEPKVKGNAAKAKAKAKAAINKGKAKAKGKGKAKAKPKAVPADPEA